MLGDIERYAAPTLNEAWSLSLQLGRSLLDRQAEATMATSCGDRIPAALRVSLDLQHPP